MESGVNTERTRPVPEDTAGDARYEKAEDKTKVHPDVVILGQGLINGWAVCTWPEERVIHSKTVQGLTLSRTRDG